MDRDPLEQFAHEAQSLDDGAKLVFLAELMAGDSAWALLIGAALKAMEAQFGYDGAILRAKMALETIANPKPGGGEYN